MTSDNSRLKMSGNVKKLARMMRNASSGLWPNLPKNAT